MSPTSAFSTRVLVLSGDAVRRPLISVILKRRGAAVTEAATVAQARGALDSPGPDALLVDAPALAPEATAEVEHLLDLQDAVRLLLVDERGARRRALEELRSQAIAVLSTSLEDRELTGALKLVAAGMPVPGRQGRAPARRPSSVRRRGGGQA
jgi:DNA-binding NtrC family response regulator